MKKIPLIVIVGPTAVGKTALSIELAKRFNAEIISGDSMQVYRYMDIGTAKIKPNETEDIPHHLIDILDPDEGFNARIFKEKALIEIDQIMNRQHLPMIVGGTGLYINGLLYDYQFDGKTNSDYREKIYYKIKEEGSDQYYEELLKHRPDLSTVIHKNDAFRISRALEIIHTTGKDSIANFDMRKNYQSPFQLCLIGLTMNRQKLYERIDFRVDKMIEEGLLEELESLMEKGYNNEMQSLQAIGYKELLAYLNHQYSYEEAVELLKKNTRHFAKRQLTWFKRDPNLKWFSVDELSGEALLSETKEYINQCLNL